MKKIHFHHLWLILAAYAVWFAVLSGLEEVVNGKYWKAVYSLALGLIVWGIIESRHKK